MIPSRLKKGDTIGIGHGKNHGILPIGVQARMDTCKKTLEFIN